MLGGKHLGTANEIIPRQSMLMKNDMMLFPNTQTCNHVSALAPSATTNDPPNNLTITNNK